MYLIHIKLFAGSHHKSTVPLSQCEVCFTNDRNRLRTTNFVSHKIEDHENKGLFICRSIDINFMCHNVNMINFLLFEGLFGFRPLLFCEPAPQI